MTRVARARVVAAAILVLGTACGSTVQYKSETAVGGTGGQTPLAGNEGLGVPGGTGTPGSGSFPGAPGSGSPSIPGFPTGGGGTGSIGSTAQGVSKDKILLGLVYGVNQSVTQGALGAEDITTGDQKANMTALMDDINSHGGVLGRKLVPVWHKVDASRDSAKPFAQLMQERCETWRSAKVFAAFDGSGDETLMQCTANAGIFVLSAGGLTGTDAAWYQRYPTYVEIGSINFDRIVTAQVAALQAQGYFAPWNRLTGAPGTGKPKLGIIAVDTSAFHHAVEKVMRPALARIGYQVSSDDVVYISDLKSYSGLSAEASQISGAVLKFNTDGVTHVQILDTQARLTLEFMREADSQRYYPRHGVNSQNGLEALLEQGLIPQSQVRGALGIGWSPSLDLPNAINPDNGPYSNESRRHCLKVLKAHGIDYTNQANASAVALGDCDTFYFFRDALTRGGPNISVYSYLTGVNSMGSSFVPASSFSTYFSSRRHDGISAIRYMAYIPSRQRVEYTSNAVNVR